MPTPPLPLPMAISFRCGLGRGHRDARFAHAGDRQRRRAQLRLERVGIACDSPLASAMIVATPLGELARANALVVRAGRSTGQRDGPSAAHRKRRPRLPLFFGETASYNQRHEHLFRAGAVALAACSPTTRDPGDRAAAATSRRRRIGRAARRPVGRAAAQRRPRTRRWRRKRLARRVPPPRPRSLWRRWRTCPAGGPVADPLGGVALVVLWLVFTCVPFDRARPARRRHPLRPLQLDARARCRLDPAVADRPGEEDRCREYPQRSTSARPSTEDLMLTGDQNLHRHRLFGALEHPHARALPVRARRSPTTPSARSRKARCARLSPRSASMTRWATSAA